MGLVKSDAQRKANQLQRKSAIAASIMRSLMGRSLQPGQPGCQPMWGQASAWIRSYEEAENDDYERKSNRGNWRHSILALLRYVQNKAWKY